MNGILTYKLNFLGPVEVLQRHVEERQEQLERRERQDAVIRARIDVVARAELRRAPSPSSSRERPETREIETQTDKTENAVDTRPNETQTDPCTKSTDAGAKDTDDTVNKPSTSESAADVIGMPGPSNRNSDFECKAKPVEASGDQSKPEAENGDEQPAVMAEPERAADGQPNPNAEPPGLEADGQERRQRLIIIHQRRHDDDDNLQNRFR